MRSLVRFIVHGLGTAAVVSGCLFVDGAGVAGSCRKKYEVLPAGTRIVVKPGRDISALGEGDGRPLEFRVACDVLLCGNVVIRQGSLAYVRLLQKNALEEDCPPVYALRLTDIDIGRIRLAVLADELDLPPGDIARSPYPAHAAGIIIAQDTPVEFLLAAPLSLPYFE